MSTINVTDPGFKVNQPKAAPAKPVTFHSLEDVDYMRQSIFDKIKSSVEGRFPVENDRYRIELANVKYSGPDSYSKKEQKDALLKRKSITRPLQGTWRMIDKASGKVVDEQKHLIAHVPYLTERGTFIRSGNEYTVSNQQRQKPGVYSSWRLNGDLQSHFNVVDTGRSFKLNLDPRDGRFTMHVGGAKLNLFPVLREMGVNDDQIKSVFDKDEFNRNNVYDDSAKRAHEQFRTDKHNNSLVEALAQGALDPDVSEATLGSRYDKITPEVMLAASKKMLMIARREADEDHRDAVPFQRLYSPDDLFAERIQRDVNQLVRNKLLWNSTRKGKLAVKPGYLTPQIDSVFLQSGLAQPLEETNPVETIDQMYRVLRTGEGGIDPERVTMDSRSVQPSYMGVIDPVRAPESGGVGTDSRLTINALRGSDGELYMNVRNREGGVTPINMKTASNAIIAFPGELQKEGRRVKAMVRGRMDHIDRRLVDYELAHPTHMSTVGINLIPMVSSVLGQRALMGGKFYNQALPVKDGEAPLVQALSDNEEDSFEKIYGVRAGAVRADEPGRVVKVTDDAVHIETASGKKKIELYNNFPFNRKTFLHNTPVVKPGDHVKPGDMLASSNFTDKEGNLALGKNLRAAYIAWKGKNFEDAVVISESAAKKMQSEHMYSMKVDHDTSTQRGTKEFLSLYPGRFNKDQIKQLGDNGVAKPGTILKKGDPVVLAVRQKPITDLHRGHKPGWMDASEVWEHDADGIVTDVEAAKNGLRVSIRSYEPMQIGDKLVGRHGDKGTIADIIPDGKMPHDKDGNPMEVLLNPLGVVTRSNTAQLIEAALGKVAQKTGKPIKMPAFSNKSMIEHAIKELEKHGLSDTDELQDPDSARTYKGILTGPRFFLKLHHMAEHKLSQRDIGGYTSEGQPSRGGDEGAKRLGLADLNALASHGATEILKDAKTIRGQQNTEFWKAFQMGKTPPSPEVPMIYKKFLSHMVGAGINVQKNGEKLNIMALTDKDIDRLSRGEVKEAKGVDLATMKEIPGGLFDKGITGGHHGNQWAHIKLPEPMPNPVMEEPIRRLLGLTEKKFYAVLAGEEQLNGHIGGKAIEDALKRINLKELKAQTENTIDSGAKSKRDNAIKLYRYINMFERTGLKPSDMMLTKAPVLPPVFRPISATSDFLIKSDANSLYVDLMKANDAYRDMKKSGFSDKDLGDERVNIYRSFKAVTGLGDPVNPKLKNQEVRGLLGQVFGTGTSPKYGMFQRRVLGGSLDTIGRAVITPDPSLDMDHVGLPEESAWKLYKPFMMREMTRRGMSAIDAVRNIKNRTDAAKRTLLDVMEERPVLISRAPVLHKYNIMAAKPRLVKGHTLQVNPLITKGFNADFDGDQMNFHVPVSDKAVREAKEKMLPSRNLFAIRDFDVHYVPSEEFQHGLYLASKKYKTEGKAVAFKDKAEALAAFRRGDIDISTPITIRG